jgi:hypothetical protein
VVILNSAGYGPFTITRTVTVQAAPGVYAGITVTSGDGVDVNAGSGTVILLGLTFTNQGSSGSGIVLNSAAVLHVESCVADGFNSETGTGTGLFISGVGNIEVKDCIFRDNAQGIEVSPSSGRAVVTIDHCRLDANFHSGLTALDGAVVTVRNTVCSANTQDGLLIASTSSRPVEVNIENCIASNNMINGIEVVSLSTGTAIARVSDSTITDNGGTGLLNGSGAPASLLSRKNNTVEGNGGGDTSGVASYTAQ